MTTEVRVWACNHKGKRTQVILANKAGDNIGEYTLLPNETRTFYAHDDQTVAVREIPVDEASAEGSASDG